MDGACKCDQLAKSKKVAGGGTPAAVARRTTIKVQDPLEVRFRTLGAELLNMRSYVVVAICLLVQVAAQNKRPQGFSNNNNNNNYNNNNNNDNYNNYNNNNNNNNYNDNNSQNYHDQSRDQYQPSKTNNQYDNRQDRKSDYSTPIPIIRFDKEQTVDGSYKTSYETGNNIVAEETGFLKNVGVDTQEALVQHGSFTYTSPEGQIITVQYTADEQGFRPFGDHLPTPPPVPAEIQKSIDLIYSQIQEQEEERKRNPNFREDDGSYKPEYNSENYDDIKNNNNRNNVVNPTTNNYNQNQNQNQNNRNNNFDQYNNNNNNNQNNNYNNNNNQNYDQNNNNNNNNNNFAPGPQKNFNHPKRRQY